MEHTYKNTYKNVTIRPLNVNDIEFLRMWRNDESNTLFLRKLPFITTEMQRLWFDKYLSNTDEICFAIDETNVLNRIVGSLSLYDFKERQAEFGKILIGDDEAHGKNIGVNSIIALLYIAFDDLKLDRIILHVYAENRGAVHIYNKVGFTIEETHISDNMTEYTMAIKKNSFFEKMEEKEYA